MFFDAEICKTLLQIATKKCIIIVQLYYNTKALILKEYFENFSEILKKVLYLWVISETADA